MGATRRHPVRHAPRLLGALAAILALAIGSLVAPITLNFDAWSWLIWGRELTSFGLETSGGPSWKPLPSLIAAVLTPFGHLTPGIWLAIVRTSWLVSVLLGAMIAVRLVSRPTLSAIPGGAASVGIATALSLILIENFRTAGWILAGIGLSEPLLVALLLASFLAHLDRRRGLAAILLLLAALIRPEVWVLAGAMAVAYRKRLPGGRVLWLAVGFGVAALWLVPDLLASGSALTGAERARSDVDSNPLLLVAERIVPMPLLALWLAAGWALVVAAGRRSRPVLELAMLASLWIATVTGLALIGYAALPRFMLPAATAVAVLGVIGLAELVAAVRERAGRADTGRSSRVAIWTAVVAVGLALLADAGWRVVQWPGDLDRYLVYASDQKQVVAAAESAAAGAGAECGLLAVQGQHLSAVAWELHRSFPETLSLELGQQSPDVLLVQGPLDAITFAGVPIDPPPSTAVPVAADGEWVAYANRCR